MAEKTLPYLSNECLESLGITTSDVIEMMEKLILGAAAGTVWNAPKAVLMPGDNRYLMATLSAAEDPPYMAVKSLALNPSNPSRGIPQINSVVALHDADTGVPLAIIEGNWVTAVRTAGLSAVAARHLANKESSVAAFIGCGHQADSHLDAFRQMFPLTEVRAMGRGKANRDRFLEIARGHNLKTVACDDAQTVVKGADIIVTSVTLNYETEAFIDARWLKKGAFTAITDLAIPWIDDSMSAFDRIVIDDLEQERAMAKPMVAKDLIEGDITGLVSGTLTPRQHRDDKIAFVFRGLALGDLALAALAWERYQ
ncbi:MAG: alanine dehydrogenase [marine bacterium B5-7]|nr:MAG: alanine dehydrogenase [marine bacterium B5-7]